MAEYRAIPFSRGDFLFLSTKLRSETDDPQTFLQPRTTRPPTISVSRTVADASSKDSKSYTRRQFWWFGSSSSLEESARQSLHRVIPSHLYSTFTGYSTSGLQSISHKLLQPWAPYAVPTAPDCASATRSIRSASRFPTAILAEKPIASADGVQVFIALAEHVLFVQGFDEYDLINQKLLRGTLNLQILHDIKLQDVTLRLYRAVKIVWAESWKMRHLPSTDVEDVEYTWPFFSAQSQKSQHGYGPDQIFLLQDSVPMKDYLGNDVVRSYYDNIEEIQLAGHVPMTPGEEHDLFTPGDYIYNFELPLSSKLP